MRSAALSVAAALTLLGPPPTGAQAPPAQATRHTLFSPSALTLLESPDRDIWQKPEQVMDALGIADGSKVADIGAGGGYFTVRLARRVGPNGIVWAEDVQPEMLEAIRRRVARDTAKDIRNVRTQQGTSSDPMLPPNSLDAVLILETLQEIEAGNRVPFLRNVRTALRPGGRLGVIDYKEGGFGPGPDGDRTAPEAVISTAEQAGFRLLKRETFLPFQFFLIFVK